MADMIKINLGFHCPICDPQRAMPGRYSKIDSLQLAEHYGSSDAQLKLNNYRFRLPFFDNLH